MRKIVFLDFDGVLHPDGIALFSRLGLLETYLSRMPDVEVVISSSWRETESIEQLRAYFSSPIREKIVGATPVLEDGYDCGGRQREIEAYLESAGLKAGNCSWVALDDTQLFFDQGYPNLILTDSSQGFTDIDGESLLSWYEDSSRAG